MTYVNRMDSNKVLLYSTGNCIPFPGINYNGKEYGKDVYICIGLGSHIYIYTHTRMKLNHFALQQELTHYKSTLHLKKINSEMLSLKLIPASSSVPLLHRYIGVYL